MAADEKKPGNASKSGPEGKPGDKMTGPAGARKSVTIDLDARDVSKASATASASAAASARADTATAAAKPVSPATASATDPAKGKAAEPSKAEPPRAEPAKAEAPKTEGSKPEKAEQASDRKPGQPSPLPKEDKPAPQKPAEAAAASAGSKSSPAPAAEAAERRGSGFGGLLAAGIAGAAVVAAAGYGLNQAGYLPAGPGAPDTEVRSLIDASQTRIAELEGRLAEFSRSDRTAGPDALAAFDKRLAELEGRVSSAADGAGQALAAEVDKLGEGLSELRRFVSSGSAGESAGLASLQQEQEALKASAGELSAKFEALQGQASAIATLQTQAASLDDRLGATEAGTKAAQETSAALAARLEELSGKVTANTQILAGLKNDIAALQGRLEPLESRVGDATAREVAARALAVAALQTALETGRPYATELAALAATLPEGKDLSALSAHAESGVPSASRLIAEFPKAARAMSAALDRPSSGDLVGTFLANARSLVSVRRLDAGDEASPEAALARMEASVAAGDLAAALTAYDTLPDAAKAAGADWAGSARARVEAERLAGEVAATVLEGLGNPSTGG